MGGEVPEGEKRLQIHTEAEWLNVSNSAQENPLK